MVSLSNHERTVPSEPRWPTHTFLAPIHRKAGGDCIDDAGTQRAGGTDSVLGCVVQAIPRPGVDAVAACVSLQPILPDCSERGLQDVPALSAHSLQHL